MSQDYIFDRFEERGVRIVIDYHGEFRDLQEKTKFSNTLKLEISEAIRRVLVERQNPYSIDL